MIRKLLALALAALASIAQAQSFPSRSVKVTVVYPAGSSGDVMMRIVAERMSTLLGHPFVIENKAGGGGLAGSTEVARAPADGYTLLLTGPNHITNLALYAKVPYDPIKDFTPIGLVGDVQAVLVANPQAGFKNVQDFIAAAKDKPGVFNFGSAGNGTGGHLAMEMFSRAAGIKLMHVPYKGASPALTDTVGGQVQVLFTGVPPTLQHIGAGKLVPLVVSGATRSPQLPNVPSMQDLGLSAHDVQIWFGILGPAGMNAEAVRVLSTTLQKVVTEPEVRAKFAAQGIIPNDPSPAAMEQLLQRDLDRWPKLIRELGIVAQ